MGSRHGTMCPLGFSGWCPAGACSAWHLPKWQGRRIQEESKSIPRDAMLSTECSIMIYCDADFDLVPKRFDYTLEFFPFLYVKFS